MDNSIPAKTHLVVYFLKYRHQVIVEWNAADKCDSAVHLDLTAHVRRRGNAIEHSDLGMIQTMRAVGAYLTPG